MTATESAGGRRQSPRLVLFNVCLGLFMTALNHRALFVSLPTLTRLFQTDLTTIQWALLVYDLTMIGLVLTLGRMGDLLGRKRIYLGGFLLFAVGSALCGLSQSVGQLITFRILQGIGGSMLTASARAIVSVAFPVEERGKAIGLTSMAFHVGFLTGPTLGGFLVDTVGWRWNFYLNIPIAIFGALLGWRVLQEEKEETRRIKIDMQGAVLLLLANISFLYAMNQIPHLGLHHRTVGLFVVVAGIALAFFIWTELHSQTPILSLSLFRNRLFSPGILSLFFISSTQSAIQFLIPFYLQDVLRFTPSQMGWIIIANSAVIVLVAPVAGWLSDRLGSRLLCTIGAGLIVVSQIFIASLTLDSTVPRIIFALALSGLGWAIFNAPNASAILGSVSQDRVGAASGVMVTAARIGGALGVALSATVFTYGLTAAGLTSAQVQSPEAWGSSPAIFMSTFNRTVHIINAFTLLSVFFSVVRGGKATKA
ncbi:MAG: MFS transporter [Candidatus Binatia bacterium]